MIIRKIKPLLSTKIAKNGMWLYVLQIFNTIIPLITLPYVTRVLGPSQYGLFSAALNIVGYFQVIVTYGFNLSGARKVALARNHKELATIYTRITFSKLALLMFSFVLMLISFLVFDISEPQMIGMLILYLMVLGTSLQQTWLFHGLEDMKFITIISVISKFTSVILVFLLVNNSEQVYLYCLLYSLTFFLNGIISIIVVSFKYKIGFEKVTAVDLWNELRDGWPLFTTSAMTKVFGSIGLTVLIFTTTETNIGVYSAIQKVPLVITMIYAPIGQVIYPYVSKKYTHSFNCGFIIVKKFLKYIMPSVFLLGISMAVASETLIGIIYGSEFSVYWRLLVPLIFWMLLSILNNLLGIQILVASGHLREYSISFKIGVTAIVFSNIILGSLFEMYGVAIAAMLGELTLTMALVFHIKRIITEKQNTYSRVTAN